MKIECLSVMPQTVPYHDSTGSVNVLTLRAGAHNYPMLKPKDDPLLEDTLRVLRKHKHIRFEDLLPSDVKVLKNKPSDVDASEYLAEKVLLKPSPVGRIVSKKRKKVKKADAGRDKKNSTPTSEPAKQTTDGGKPGGVSNKK